MAAKMSVLGLILSFYQYLRSAMARFPLINVGGRRIKMLYISENTPKSSVLIVFCSELKLFLMWPNYEYELKTMTTQFLERWRVLDFSDLFSDLVESYLNKNWVKVWSQLLLVNHTLSICLEIECVSNIFFNHMFALFNQKIFTKK